MVLAAELPRAPALVAVAPVRGDEVRGRGVGVGAVGAGGWVEGMGGRVVVVVHDDDGAVQAQPDALRVVLELVLGPLALARERPAAGACALEGAGWVVDLKVIRHVLAALCLFFLMWRLDCTDEVGAGGGWGAAARLRAEGARCWRGGGGELEGAGGRSSRGQGDALRGAGAADGGCGGGWGWEGEVVVGGALLDGMERLGESLAEPVLDPGDGFAGQALEGFEVFFLGPARGEVDQPAVAEVRCFLVDGDCIVGRMEVAWRCVLERRWIFGGVKEFCC